MVVPFVLFAAVWSSLLSHHGSMALDPQIDIPLPCENKQSDHLIRELQEAKLQIARLESILEETVHDLSGKTDNLQKSEKLIVEMNQEIDHLQSALSNIKDNSLHADEKLNALDEKINALEEEVRLLWAASRKINFELHTLESKAKDSEKRLEVVTSEVKRLGDIITEQWIQIQQLEQAVQMAEKRTFKVKRQVGSTRCTFLKFMKKLGHHAEKKMKLLDPYLFGKGFVLRSYFSQALHHLQKSLSTAKHYHHQLQGLVKEKMERNDFTAALANEEVVFFVASALIVFPVMSAWMFLSSQFG